MFEGRKIYAPNELMGLYSEFDKIIIASSAYEVISNTLQELGLIKDKDYLTLPI